MSTRLRASGARLHRPPAWVVALVLVLCGGCRGIPAAGVTDGVSVVTGTDVVRLDRGWEARPGESSERPDVVGAGRSGEWQAVEMPSTFRAQGIADGVGVWYRLRLRLDPQRAMRGTLPPLVSPYRLYAVQPSGDVARLAESGMHLSGGPASVRQSFALPAASEITLVWFVGPSGAATAGPYRVPRVGEAIAVERSETGRLARVFATLGAFSMLLLASLVVWRRRPDDLRPFALTLLAGVLALRAFVVSDVAEVLVPAWGAPARAMLTAMTLFLLLAGTGVLVWTFFPVECAPWQGRRLRLLPPVLANEPSARQRAPRWLRSVFTASVVGAWALGLGGAIAAVAASDPVASPLLNTLKWLVVVPFAGLTAAVTTAAVFRRRGARTVVAGAWLATAAVAHDMLVATGHLPGTDTVLVYAFFAFLVLLSATYTDVFARGAREVTDLAGVLSERVAVRTRELEAASAAAQAANQAKTQFISSVSHELRTPIAAMLGYAQLLGDELDETLTPTQREFFGVIQTSGHRLIALVSDLLDVALIESGRFEVRLGPVPLPEIVREVVRQVTPLAREKGLDLDIDIVPDVAVVASAQRLRQVLLNILANAIKFTDRGGISLTVSDAVLDGSPAVAIAIADTGPGIDDDFLPMLFDRFAQAPSAYDATQQGVGIGLALVKEFVSRMNGRVEVDSVVGTGTTFTVTLPRAVPVENRRDAA